MATDREILRNRIVERLNQLDVEALRQLEALLAHGDFGPGPAAPEEHAPRLLTRRQLLAGLLGGGAALSGTNLATAWYARQQGEAVGWQRGTGAGEMKMAIEASRTRQELQAEIDALRGLVAHYEALEHADLDQAVAQSVARFEKSVAGLQSSTGGLAEGIEAVRGALDRFEASLADIRQGVSRVEDALDALDQRLAGLREVLSDAADRAEPVADRLGAFFDTVFDRLPFGIGERIELVVSRVRQVVGAVPAAIGNIREDLLAPLQSKWLAEAGEDNVQTGLLTPIRTRVLEPVDQLLADLDEVADAWQRDVTEPVQRTLTKRQVLRRTLDEYKQRHRLG